MGNRFGRTSNDSGVRRKSLYDFPRPVSLSKSSVLVCLDICPTPSSSRLKTCLKGTFGSVVLFNSEKGLIDHIQSTIGCYYFIVIVGKVKEVTLQSLVKNSKIGSIYLCLGKEKEGKIPQSIKMKGFFEKQIELNRAIYHDVCLH